MFNITLLVINLYTDTLDKILIAIFTISAHFCISAYFLTVQTYKRMRLTTQVYGINN